MFFCAKRNFQTIFFWNSMVRRHKSRIILGIETSCDDTGCAIVNKDGTILSETLHSQHLVHLRHGGINPLVAQDLHREHIDNVVCDTLEKALLKIDDIDGIAVTSKPGLLVCLCIGVKYAKYISYLNNKPLIPIHHMEAHALIARMYNKINFPFLVLLISGGHCLLALVSDVEEFFLLGESLDDSPGEAFDKTARRMKLRNIPELSKMSGGKAIETAALKATNPGQFEFPVPLIRLRDCNFSFSGLKDAVVRKLIRKEKEHNITGDGIIPEVYDLCAAFQMAVAQHLVHRTQRAVQFCELKNLLPSENKTLVVSGGVACNNFIFQSLEFVFNKLGYNVYRPPPPVCIDNGVMIAWNAIEKLNIGSGVVKNISQSDIDPKAPLGKSRIADIQCANLRTKLARIKY